MKANNINTNNKENIVILFRMLFFTKKDNILKAALAI